MYLLHHDRDAELQVAVQLGLNRMATYRTIIAALEVSRMTASMVGSAHYSWCLPDWIAYPREYSELLNDFIRRVDAVFKQTAAKMTNLTRKADILLLAAQSTDQVTECLNSIDSMFKFQVLYRRVRAQRIIAELRSTMESAVDGKVPLDWFSFRTIVRLVFALDESCNYLPNRPPPTHPFNARSLMEFLYPGCQVTEEEMRELDDESVRVRLVVGVAFPWTEYSWMDELDDETDEYQSGTEDGEPDESDNQMLEISLTSSSA